MRIYQMDFIAGKVLDSKVSSVTEGIFGKDEPTDTPEQRQTRQAHAKSEKAKRVCGAMHRSLLCDC